MIERDFARDEHGRIILTYSALRMFKACRRSYFWRYIQQLAPAHIPITDPRPVGSGMHEALAELVRDARNPPDLGEVLREYYEPDRNHDHWQVWMRSVAMIAGYRTRWHGPDSDQVDLAWEPVLVERAFTGDIIDPATGDVSPDYCMEGKVDACVRVLRPGLWGGQEIEPGLYLGEHKSSSRIDQPYVKKLWCDDQMALYSHYISEALGEEIKGCLYNVVGKTKLDHRQAETKAAFTRRKDEAQAQAEAGELGRRLRLRKGEPEDAFKRRRIAKGLEEVAALTRIEAQPVEEYAAQLAAVYMQPDMFHRSALALDQRMMADVLTNLWELTHQHRAARERGHWGKNKDNCWKWGRACDFWPICTSWDSPMIIEEGFRLREANNELKKDEGKDF